MFFLKCKENGIPTPDTNLLSPNLIVAKKELEELDCWPVILKRIDGTCGEYVDKAEDINSALKIIKKV